MTLTMPDYYRAQLVPADELRGRVARFQEALAIAELGAALITHNTGLYYLAGTIQPAQLYVPREGEPLLLVRRNEERILLESTWPTEELTSFKNLATVLQSRGGTIVPSDLGLELDVLPVLSFQRYQKALPDVTWHDCGAILRAQRSIKTVWEIEKIRSVRSLADAMLAAIPTLLEAGQTELEFSARLEGYARSQGHQGRTWFRAYNQEMYWGQLLAGSNGTVGSYFDSPNGGWGLNPAKPDGVGMNIIEANVSVLVDYVAAQYGYNLDQTRTAVVGTLPDSLQRAYEQTVAIQAAVVAAARPGVLGSELFTLAQQVAEENGILDGFGGRGRNQARFVGHGVGIEIDELPLLAAGWHEPLQAGMVFALEPKYTDPTLGIVGLENTWLVTEDGVERLTSDNDEVIVING